MTVSEIYNHIEQNKGNITEDEKQGLLKELLKLLFVDEYNKMVINVFEDIKAELLKGYVDDNPKNYEYTIVPLKEVLEIIDKYRKGEQ